MYTHKMYNHKMYTHPVYTDTKHIKYKKYTLQKCIQIFPDFLSLLLTFRLYHRRQIPNFMNRIVIKSTVRAWVTAFGLG
jgi:hypothetical protein